MKARQKRSRLGPQIHGSYCSARRTTGRLLSLGAASRSGALIAKGAIQKNIFGLAIIRVSRNRLSDVRRCDARRRHVRVTLRCDLARGFLFSSGPLLFGLQTWTRRGATGRKRHKPVGFYVDKTHRHLSSRIAACFGCKNARPVSAPDHSSIASNSRNALSNSSKWTM
jgi:hypothetical protein